MFTSSTHLIRQVKVVRNETSDSEVVDLRISDGRVVQLANHIEPLACDTVIEGNGRFVIPGLWDQHVHMGLWSQSSSRLDISATREPADVLAIVKTKLESEEFRASGAKALIAAGFRKSTWTTSSGTRDLDAITGDIPTVLISGDVHCGWLNSAAYRMLGLEVNDDVIEEVPWFNIMPRITELEAAAESDHARYSRAIHDAHSKGIVGIRDYEFSDDCDFWPEFVAAGAPKLRVKVSVYPHLLDYALGRGYRTGTELAPLVEMGSLKMISDGSLGTMTAYCCEPYGSNQANPFGKQNYQLAEMIELLTKAKAGGLEISLHAIGDAAASDAIDAFEITGAKGRLEHAQLLRLEDVKRMGHLGIGASVQPIHLLDDREMTFKHWPDRENRCYLFATMLREGVKVTFGSDAPVAPIDPWGAIDAAVYRARNGEAPWNPAEVLTVGQALFASVNFEPPVAKGSLADLVLLDNDPHSTKPSEVRVALTMVDGSIVFENL